LQIAFHSGESLFLACNIWFWSLTYLPRISPQTILLVSYSPR
jgi:hypothetical protein